MLEQAKSKAKPNGSPVPTAADVAAKPASEQSELARLRAENEALRAKVAARNTISFKLSEKRALSVYGLGRFPVTLYKRQWIALLAKLDELREHLKDPQLADDDK